MATLDPNDQATWIAQQLGAAGIAEMSGNPAFDQLATACAEWIDDAGIVMTIDVLRGALCALSLYRMRLPVYYDASSNDPGAAFVAIAEVAATFQWIAERQDIDLSDYEDPES